LFLRIGTELRVHSCVLIVAGMFLYLAFGLTDAKAEVPIEGTAIPVKVGDATTSSRLIIDNNFIDPSHNCERCTRMVYTPGPQQEAGVAYKDDKLDLGNSQRIVFFAKGQPSEQVSFVAVGNDTQVSSKNDTEIFTRINFSVVTDNVSLTNDWQRFEIGLNGTALSDATYPFGIQLAADSTQKQIFYIKGVTLDNEPAQNPIPTVYDSLNSTSINSTELLTAHINANSTNSSAPATIEFRANSTGGLAPYLFSWNFDDGDNSTSNGQRVLHTFYKSGLYNITLTAKDSGTTSQNAFANTLVTIISSANQTTNATNSVNATGTNSVNATGTNSVNSNSTRSVISTKIPETNGTVRIAPGVHDQDSATKFDTKKIEQFSIAIDKNITIGSNKAADVESINHIPVALDQSVMIYGNKVADIDLRGSDEDNDRIKFELVSDPLEGVLVGFDNKEGTVTYIPNPFFVGSDSFTFNVIDIHNGKSNIAHVSISIAPTQNTVPKVSDVDATTFSNAPVTIFLKETSQDNAGSLKFSLLSNPSHGKLSELSDVGGTSTRVIYTPDEDFAGKDVFKFKVNDQNAGTHDVATVSIKVIASPKATNSDPEATAQNTETSQSPREKNTPSETITRALPSRNHNPSANADVDITLQGDTNYVTLKGTGKDPDGDTLLFSWKQTSGPIVQLMHRDSPITSFNVSSLDEDKILRFILTVRDGKGGEDTDGAKVIIKGNDLVDNQLRQNHVQGRVSGNQTLHQDR
jgi:PKD repeat protein